MMGIHQVLVLIFNKLGLSWATLEKEQHWGWGWVVVELWLGCGWVVVGLRLGWGWVGVEDGLVLRLG